MIRVLVVDDSLFMRTLISDILSSNPEIEVINTAKSGFEAVKKIPKIKPDVITLDLVMPGWDGLTTLKHIMAEYPTPVVLLSAYSKKGADITIKCLNAGAVGFVLKPSGELSLDIKNIKNQLLEEVIAASEVNVRKIQLLKARIPVKTKRKLIGKNKIIVIGASTGGPQTLEVILSCLPADFTIPILIVQHMPSRLFTRSLTGRLNNNCELIVKEAENNEIIQTGKVYLAPSGFRMTAKVQKNKSNLNVVISLEQEDIANLTPSIDATMTSVANLYKKEAMGIVLTGMGRDGTEGMKKIKEKGGETIVQDESSLIFGMPKAVIDEGYADKVLSVEKICDAIMKYG